MKTSLIKINTIALAMAMTFVGCNKKDNPKEDPVVIEENELITTVKLTLTPNGGGTAITLTSKDDDGTGPKAPVYTVSGNLTSGTTYNGVVKFLNETKNPPEDITEEIGKESNEHQVFYQFTTLSAEVVYVDKDTNGKNLGLKTTIKPTSKGQGKLTITLLHELNKAQTGTSGGDPTNAGGSTDVKVTFDIKVD